MPQVTAVLIAYNEEADIGRALKSVAWCDEIVVVDSGSTDRTVEICEGGGCKVFQREFNGYGEQKAFAVSQSSNDWVLVIDADEEVTPELRDEIQARLESAGDCRGFRIPITTLLWDHVLRTGSRHTGFKLRLFDHRYGNFGKQLVHESVFLNGRTELLRERMYNYSYANIADYFDKFNRYTSAAALQMFQEGKDCTVVSAVFRLPLTFFQLLLVKGYIWDGAAGTMWSLFSAFYPAVKYLKLWELRRNAARHNALEPAPRKAQYSQQSNPLSSTSLSLEADAVGENSPVSSAPARRNRWLILVPTSIAAAIAIALLWMPLLGMDVPGDYAACLLFVVFVTACFGGRSAALLATVFSVLALDYFAISPSGRLSVPNIEDVFRLALFLALSLLTISIVYKIRRRSIH